MTLSSQNKRWLGEHLIAEATKEEGVNDSRSTRVCRVRRRAVNAPSDAVLEARFAGLQSPQLPDDPEWDQVISSNSGKTIKPVEKWL